MYFQSVMLRTLYCFYLIILFLFTGNVYLQGYKQRDAFIITQMTLPKTIADFWAMIYDQDCRTVIMMNNLDLLDSVSLYFY